MNDFENFLQAIVYGDLREVHSLFNKDHLNRQNAAGAYPVHIACQLNREDILKFFIDNDCDIELCDTNDSRPIHVACANGYEEIIKLLIDKNCDLYCTRKDDKLPYDITKDNHCREILDQEVAKRIAISMGLTCGPVCDHEFCYNALVQKDFKKDILIGMGSISELYKLQDHESKRQFAVKIIQILDEDEISKEAKYVERNINKFLKTLRHPNIVKYFGAIHIEKKLHIFMEFMTGGTIQEKIKKEGSFPHQDIMKYARQILGGLAYLHSNNIIHRDVKPPNILIGENGNIKLIDFGESRLLELISKSHNKNKNESATTVCGTPNYTAPEVILGGPYDFKADVWSVGATVVEMLTGKVPLYHLTPNKVIMHLGQRKEIEFTPVVPMSKGMEDFVNQLLEPNPQNRQTAETLLTILTNDPFLLHNTSRK